MLTGPLTTPNKRLSLTILLLLGSMALYFLSGVKLPILDTNADRYFEESIKGATLAYASVRGVNAVVSVLKESEIEVSPAGVGVNIAAGQILDPIDDMTERLSDVMVASIVSLGIQKIGYEIGSAISFKALALLVLLLIPLIWIQNQMDASISGLLLRIGVLLLALRFLLPVSSLVSDTLYQNVLKARIDQGVENLSIVSSSYEELSSLEHKKENGFFASITPSGSEKIQRAKRAFFQVMDNVERIISSLLELTTLYIMAFIVQTLLLPLLMLWIMVRIMNRPIIGRWAGRISAPSQPKPSCIKDGSRGLPAGSRRKSPLL